MESLVGTDVAGYHVEALIARGGMGVVYRARQLSLDRLVALKVIAPELALDPLLRERFVRESRLAASIDHPNVIPIYEADEHNGLLYIAMRYVEGSDLRQLLSESGALAPARAGRLIFQIAAGLDAAHARGLVHRDVKPANVLITTDGDIEHAYLTDFGLVKRSASETGVTKPGSWAGTVDYVAPEQLRGDPVDARADVYALGCLLYETLTGEVPFPRDSDVAKLFAHLSDPPPTLARSAPQLPAVLDAIIGKALAKAPADRFRTTGLLAAALNDALTLGSETQIDAAPLARPEAAGNPGEPAVSQPSPAPRAPLGRSRRKIILAGFTAMASVLLGALAATGFFGSAENSAGNRARAADQAVAEFRQSVGGLCSETNRVQAARKRRFAAFRRKVTGTNALALRVDVVIDEIQTRLTATGDLISRLDALSPPSELVADHRTTVGAWKRNVGRLQSYRDGLRKAVSTRAVGRQLSAVPASAIERDATTVTTGLRRMGGPTCDLDPATADPVVRVPLPGGSVRLAPPPPLNIPPPSPPPPASAPLNLPPPPPPPPPG